MAKLVVEVLNADDLLPTDDQGSPSPFVQVEFHGLRHRTQTKTRDLHPSWNEKLVFNIRNPRNLYSSTIEVTIYDDRCANRSKNVLGCVRISGASVPLSGSEAVVERYALCKRDSFSHGRGDISLRIYTIRAQYYRNQPQHRRVMSKKNPKLEEINEDDDNKHNEGGTSGGAEPAPEAERGSNAPADDVVHLGTQEDDGTGIGENFGNTSSNVYYNPTLYYLRIDVLEAQDLAPLDMNRAPEFQVSIQLGFQRQNTSISSTRNSNPVWKEVLMFVVSEPLDDLVVISVVDVIEPGKKELTGRAVLPARGIPQRFDSTELLPARWLNLDQISSVRKKKKQGKILLRLCLEGGYHVFDSLHGDFQPTAKHLKEDSIGSLELEILSARNLVSLKQRDGIRTTDAYCVAKYGNKWVCTRTILNSQKPCWNERYSWEVYDPYTVITIGVFDNSHVDGSKKGARDLEIGKVKIPVQTLEVNRLHTHYYPLLVLHPSGLKNCGELQLAVRLTGVAWANMVARYTKLRLPKMHYLQPITVEQVDMLRHFASQIVALRLSQAEPPLRKEIVDRMLDVRSHMWSMRKQKANFDRLMSFVLGIAAAYRWFDAIREWRNPLKTIFVHFFYLVLVWHPNLILPLFFLSLSMMGLWNYRFRPRNPPQLDARLSHAHVTDPDYLDEEFDTFPTSRPLDIVKMRYDRLRSIAGRYQTVAGDIATLGERAMAILTCEDLRGTLIFTTIAFFWVVVIFMASFRVVATLLGLYWLRHPRFRNKMPPLLVNLLNRLPSKTDLLF